MSLNKDKASTWLEEVELHSVPSLMCASPELVLEPGASIVRLIDDVNVRAYMQGTIGKARMLHSRFLSVKTQQLPQSCVSTSDDSDTLSTIFMVGGSSSCFSTKHPHRYWYFYLPRFGPRTESDSKAPAAHADTDNQSDSDRYSMSENLMRKFTDALSNKFEHAIDPQGMRFALYWLYQTRPEFALAFLSRYYLFEQFQHSRFFLYFAAEVLLTDPSKPSHFLKLVERICTGDRANVHNDNDNNIMISHIVNYDDPMVSSTFLPWRHKDMFTRVNPNEFETDYARMHFSFLLVSLDFFRGTPRFRIRQLEASEIRHTCITATLLYLLPVILVGSLVRPDDVNVLMQFLFPILERLSFLQDYLVSATLFPTILLYFDVLLRVLDTGNTMTGWIGSVAPDVITARLYQCNPFSCLVAVLQWITMSCCSSGPGSGSGSAAAHYPGTVAAQHYAWQ
jgi:hypothetical protein